MLARECSTESESIAMGDGVAEIVVARGGRAQAKRKTPGDDGKGKLLEPVYNKTLRKLWPDGIELFFNRKRPERSVGHHVEGCAKFAVKRADRRM